MGEEEIVLVLPGGQVSKEAVFEALAALARGGASLRAARDSRCVA
jgi:hypothetical protein